MDRILFTVGANNKLQLSACRPLKCYLNQPKLTSPLDPRRLQRSDETLKIRFKLEASTFSQERFP